MKESKLFKKHGYETANLVVKNFSVKFEVIVFFIGFQGKGSFKGERDGASEKPNGFNCFVSILFVCSEVATNCCLV